MWQIIHFHADLIFAVDDVNEDLQIDASDDDTSSSDEEYNVFPKELRGKVYKYAIFAAYIYIVLCTENYQRFSHSSSSSSFLSLPFPLHHVWFISLSFIALKFISELGEQCSVVLLLSCWLD